MISPARLLSFLPLAMEQRGAPPMPNKFANALNIVMIGNVSPSPVSASVPFDRNPAYIDTVQQYCTED